MMNMRASARRFWIRFDGQFCEDRSVTQEAPQGACKQPNKVGLMRIIISRKGFDSKYGGVPSPILPDGRLLSLPIPLADNLTYSEIRCDGASVG